MKKLIYGLLVTGLLVSCSEYYCIDGKMYYRQGDSIIDSADLKGRHCKNVHWLKFQIESPASNKR